MVRRGITAAILILLACLSIWAAGKKEKPKEFESWLVYQNSKTDDVGYVHIIQKPSEDKKAPWVVIVEERICKGGKSVPVDLILFAKDNRYLTPVRFVCQGGGSGGGMFSAEVNDGKIEARAGRKKIEREMPENTAPFMALFRIVEDLPFDKNKVFKFSCLRSTSLKVGKNQKIEYEGKKKVDPGNREIKLHQFLYSDKDGKIGYFWLDDNHRLISALIAGRETFTRTTPKRARQVVEECLDVAH
ncbi:MAG: hypothetical protein KGZ25_02590 [Planctomycetes bacterium]|nr:hypothetical protein [Planctomycetota bacterium]